MSAKNPTNAHVSGIAASTRSTRRQQLLWLGLPLLLTTSVKLWLALTTFGTNDVRYWQTFMNYLVEHGSVTIYRDIWYYNHPPMISGLLLLLHSLVDHAPNGFPFLIRLPAIVADIFSVFAVYRLVRHYWTEQRALICAAGLALSPILVLVSGFHGNTDTVFLCLVLLARVRAVVARAPLSGGAVL
jgi:4-amino-4-deoxy-L-arabinose transferase-like glycosyltransferase